jgi:hypothetical protein
MRSTRDSLKQIPSKPVVPKIGTLSEKTGAPLRSLARVQANWPWQVSTRTKTNSQAAFSELPSRFNPFHRTFLASFAVKLRTFGTVPANNLPNGNPNAGFFLQKELSARSQL